MRPPVLIFLIDSCACRDMISEVSWWSSLEAFYMAINPDKLNEFLGKAIVDFGATFNAALIRIGDKLGLYKGLAAGGPQTSAELATRTGTAERYVREWLSAQAAGGYVTYDPGTKKFHLTEEQAFAMADDNSPAFLP